VTKLPGFLLVFNVKENHFQQLINFTKCSCLSIAFFSVFAFNTLQAQSNDSDGDGLSDAYETKIGTESYLSDTDGDGIKDGVEIGKNLKTPLDSDNDSVIDALDYDDDNDGLPTFLESKKDSDKDGLLDYLDSDSDNDGVADGEEAGYLNKDKNLDGIDDAFDLGRKGAVDNNGDGIDDNVKLPDHDQDGKPDYLDAKFKNQKVKTILVKKPDIKPKKTNMNLDVATAQEKLKKVIKNKTPIIPVVENKKATAKVDPMVINRHTDSDNDGLSNELEKMLGTNHLKRDSDGDKVSDAIEIGLDVNSPLDSDRDGIIDALDEDDDNDGVLTKFEDLNQDSTAINDDTDQDGVPNYLDANDDGDSKLTRDEGFVLDSDSDGILDYLDKNDGSKDVITSSNKMASKNIETVKEPEVVVLFDGDAAALTAEDEQLDGAHNEDSIGQALSDTSLDSVEEIDQKASEKQTRSKLANSKPSKKYNDYWNLF